MISGVTIFIIHYCAVAVALFLVHRVCACAYVCVCVCVCVFEMGQNRYRALQSSIVEPTFETGLQPCNKIEL